MCRIAGLSNNLISLSETANLVQQMCDVLKHGGPDDQGIYKSDTCSLVLGHRRLSLIDLSSGGHQPMAYNNSRYYITYNGELYNYLELKEELKKAGCCFYSSSDTEVILAAFSHFGVAAFDKFNGMFAFAIWDTVTQNLYLARDAAGIKPLYFAHTKEGLAFASEVRAFKKISYLQEPHPNWQLYLMAYGHLPEPITTLKEVVPLQKGWYLQYNTATGECIQKQFAAFAFTEQITDRQQAVAAIKETLTAAVERHLLSDAPIGVFLSGGLDSSIIAQLAGKQHPNLNTVSLYFQEKGYSEKVFQDMVQKGLHGHQYQQLLQEDVFHEGLPAIIEAMDLPSCDGINTWFISKYAKENGLKAVLSGIGADEMFGGYPSFKRMQHALTAQKMLPNALLRNSSHNALKAFKRICYLSIPGGVGTYLFLRGQYVPREIAGYLDASEAEVWKLLEASPALPDLKCLSDRNQASWIEFNMYMQNQLLRDTDVMSMAHGIEIRVPFLDKEFIGLAMKISSHLKYEGEYKKQLLIDSFKDVLPPEIWQRPKMGFSFPFKQWLVKDEYAHTNSTGKKSDYHQMFLNGKLHWSQFLLIFLMESQ